MNRSILIEFRHTYFKLSSYNMEFVGIFQGNRDYSARIDCEIQVLLVSLKITYILFPEMNSTKSFFLSTRDSAKECFDESLLRNRKHSRVWFKQSSLALSQRSSVNQCQPLNQSLSREVYSLALPKSIHSKKKSHYLPNHNDSMSQ